METPPSARLLRPPPPPVPPPLPHHLCGGAHGTAANEAAPSPIKTSHDRVGTDVLDYILKGSLVPEDGLQFVSQRLLSRIDAAVAADRSKGLGADATTEMDISPLLMAMPNAKGRLSGSMAPHALPPDVPRESRPQGRYLPLRGKPSPVTHVNVENLLKNAEAYAAKVSAERREESWAGVGTSNVYVKGIDAYLKMPGPRPANRISPGQLLLQPCGVLYHEFDAQLDSDVLHEIDSSL